MKKFIAICLSISSLLLLASCQKNPTMSVIESKSNSIISDSNFQNEISNEYNNKNKQTKFPDYWQSKTQTDQVNLIIDASVNAPTFETIDIKKVIPDVITKEKFDMIFNDFFTNQNIYDKLNEMTLTKDNISSMIIDIKKTLSDLNANNNQENAEQVEIERNSLENYIKQLEEDYKSAPETIDTKSISITDDVLNNGGVFYVCEPNSAKITGGIMIGSMNSENGKTAKLILQFASNEAVITKSEYNNSLTISSEKAIEIAKENLAKLSIENMSINKTFVEKTPMGEMHTVIFVKEYYKLPETYVYRNEFEAQMNNYDFVWTNEYVKMNIDDEGIKLIEWNAMSNAGDILNKNAELLPFEKIIEKATQFIKVKDAWIDESSGIIKKQISINDICLGVMKVKMKDSINDYMFIPVWDFFGTSVDKYASQQPGGYQLDENMEYFNDNPTLSYLTINAIDGSIINRSLGY